MTDVSQGIHEMLDKYRAAETRIRELEAERDAAYCRGLEEAAKVADAIALKRRLQIEAPCIDVVDKGRDQIIRWAAGKLQAELLAEAIRALATKEQSKHRTRK